MTWMSILISMYPIWGQVECQVQVLALRPSTWQVLDKFWMKNNNNIYHIFHGTCVIPCPECFLYFHLFTPCPLQYSGLENPMDRGPWQATVHGVAKSQTRLSDWSRMRAVGGLTVCLFMSGSSSGSYIKKPTLTNTPGGTSSHQS